MNSSNIDVVLVTVMMGPRVHIRSLTMSCQDAVMEQTVNVSGEFDGLEYGALETIYE
jgi:hypothetical protein